MDLHPLKTKKSMMSKHRHVGWISNHNGQGCWCWALRSLIRVRVSGVRAQKPHKFGTFSNRASVSWWVTKPPLPSEEKVSFSTLFFVTLSLASYQTFHSKFHLLKFGRDCALKMIPERLTQWPKELFNNEVVCTTATAITGQLNYKPWQIKTSNQ